MGTQPILQKMEISFWDIVIPLLSSSPAFRQIFKAAYKVIRTRRSLIWIPPLVITWASVGLITGLILGRMGAVLW